MMDYDHILQIWGGCHNKQKSSTHQPKFGFFSVPNARLRMPQNGPPSLSALGSETLIARWGSVPSHEGPQCHLELVSHASFVVESQQIATNSNKACNKAIPHFVRIETEHSTKIVMIVTFRIFSGFFGAY
jgi:hypothetical protein